MLDVAGGEVEGHRLVVLSGEVDMANVGELVAAVAPADGAVDDVIVDVEGVDYLDSFGVRALVDAMAARRSAQRELLLVCSPGSAADLTLRVAGFGDDVVFETRKAAAARLSSSDR